jgi:putative DNA primase/helicase
MPKPTLTALDRFRDALTAHNCNPRGTAPRCPAHDDRNASLSFGPATQFAGAVMHCHANCSVDDILAVLGLTRNDLFDEPRQSKQGEAVIAEYQYRDETGEVLHGKWRYWPKRFIQWRPTPNGGKEFKLDGVRRVLFQLPELLAAKARGENHVYLVEGEEDVLALERAGVVATTWTEGAWQPGQKPKWRTEYSQTLAGWHVTIVQDRDDAGRQTAKDITADLDQHAPCVKIVEAAEGKDARDHLNAGRSVNEFVPVADDEANADQHLDAVIKLLEQLRTWQHLPDPAHVIVALAAAATRNSEGEPCWVLLVAPPSSGKTETVRTLDDIADADSTKSPQPGSLAGAKARPRP